MQLIDIGANLAHDSFDIDRDSVISQAQQAGVSHIILTGSDAESNIKTLELAQAMPGVLSATAGLHPHHADDWDDHLADMLARHAQVTECRALGEMGLDYFRNFSEPAVQQRVFARQLAIACEYDMPVFLHQRDAHKDFLPILKDYLPELPAAVVHCFTGQAHELDDYLELDLYIGITGWICDERRGTHLLDCVDRIPDNRLMIETDSPYLMPRTIQPKPKTRRNVPANLPWVLETLAAARQQTPAALAELTTQNARRFFALD